MKEAEIEELIKYLQEAEKIYEQNENLFIVSPKELIKTIIEYGKLKKELERNQEYYKAHIKDSTL